MARREDNRAHEYRAGVRRGIVPQGSRPQIPKRLAARLASDNAEIPRLYFTPWHAERYLTRRPPSHRFFGDLCAAWHPISSSNGAHTLTELEENS
jgi:hypothetical protein